MPTLNIGVLISTLKDTRIRLYELYVYTLDMGMADALLNECNRLDQIIRQLEPLSGQSVKPA
jgi:hypothetical protein